jgi:hypothetical protein
MDYYKIIKVKLNLALTGKIKIVDLIEWVNQIYEQFFFSQEYKYVTYRLINNILIELKDLADELDNINSINEKEQVYVNELLSKQLSYLSGEERYIEIYKIKINNFDKNDKHKKIIEDSIQTVLSQNELSTQKIESLKKLIIKTSNLTVDNILINEIIDSVLIINIANSSFNQFISIRVLGKLVNTHTLSSEIEYLNNLYSALKGDKSIRFSLAFNGKNILYTNIFVVSC